MIVSIVHRATGLALTIGALVLATWLGAISNGPEGYERFHAVADTPLGLFVLFGLTWSLAFHMLNGIRHLAWDIGYGFAKTTAHATALVVTGLSLLIVLGIFALAWSGHAGYLSQ